jgi:hypothetical protein
VPRVHVQDRRSDFAAAALDTLSLRAGVKLERPHPATRDMGRMSMLDIATQCLRNVGINPDRMSATRVFNTAFTHTTSDFPGIAGDLFERILMTSYQGEPDTSAGWTVTSELRDFREVSRVRFSEAPDLEFVPEGAEITFASFNERVERYRLSTYARAFSVTRQLLLNDDLQAFADLPASFGRAARRRHLDNVWAVVTGNPAMSDGENLFSAAHGNDLTPAALSLESLTAARLAMRTMKGEAGKVTLNLIPRFLLVPASLEGTAEALVSSLIPPGSTTATPSLQFIRNLEVVCEPRLDEASTTAWYLACDPAQLQSIEQGFLGGVPFEIEEKTGFDVDGIAWKVRSDHAAAPLEWRSIVRNAGA